MNGKYFDKEIKYDGTQLSSHFAYKNFGIPDDSVIAFSGPADVKLTEMVDIEDVLNKDPISADRMLHFIVEIFGLDLTGTICLQRLLMTIIQEIINEWIEKPEEKKFRLVRRDGDDLFYDKRKLSVSIATASPVSTMIHTALNIEPTGAPITISCLEEMEINPKELALEVIKQFSGE